MIKIIKTSKNYIIFSVFSWYIYKICQIYLVSTIAVIIFMNEFARSRSCLLILCVLFAFSKWVMENWVNRYESGSHFAILWLSMAESLFAWRFEFCVSIWILPSNSSSSSSFRVSYLKILSLSSWFIESRCNFQVFHFSIFFLLISDWNYWTKNRKMKTLSLTLSPSSFCMMFGSSVCLIQVRNLTLLHIFFHRFSDFDWIILTAREGVQKWDSDGERRLDMCTMMCTLRIISKLNMV